MTLAGPFSPGVLNVRKGWIRGAITASFLLSLVAVPDSTEAAKSSSPAKQNSGTTVKKAPTASKTAVRRPVRPGGRTAAQSARARQARIAKAKAAASRASWLDAQTPRYKLDSAGVLVPDVRAAAAIIYNPETGEVLWEENSQLKRSIASITKVMTAAVVLEDDPATSTGRITRICMPVSACRLATCCT
jgi:hypothetical protein